MRITAMEIDQNAQDDFRSLKPRCVEEQLEEEGAAAFERDIVTADYIRNEVSRKQEGEEQSDANEKKWSVVLNNYSNSKKDLSPNRDTRCRSKHSESFFLYVDYSSVLPLKARRKGSGHHS